MTEKEIIEEEGERLLEDYFDTKKIEEADDPFREVMNQASNLRGFGILEKISKDPKLASELLGRELPPRPWSGADIGKVKSLRTRGGNLSKLASTLGRTPSSLYSLVSRLIKKGEIEK